MPRRVVVGAVAGAFGVRGAVRVKSFCAKPAAIAAYGPLHDDTGRTYTLSVVKPLAGGCVARLSGIDTRQAAEALRGQRLWGLRSAFPALPDDEFYHDDLIGLKARDPRGNGLGSVCAVHPQGGPGGGDLLETRLADGTTVLVPFTRAIVPEVDLDAGRVVIDPPAGLFPDRPDGR